MALAGNRRGTSSNMGSSLESSMTFKEMILDCAERWGKADQTGTLPGIPTDAADLNLVKRKINAGYRQFLAADPKWSFVRQRYSLTFYPDGDGPQNIQSDAGRYRLPSWICSQPKSDWMFVTASGPRGCIPIRPYELVRRQLADTASGGGQPAYSAVGPVETGDAIGGQSKGWEALFSPRPSTAYTVEAMFRVTRHDLTDLYERHVAGSEHDRTILAFADWEWFRDDAENPTTTAIYQQARDAQLAQSIRVDREYRGRHHGKLVDPSIAAPAESDYTDRTELVYDGSVLD